MVRNYTMVLPFLARQENFSLCAKVLCFYKEQAHEDAIIIALSGMENEKNDFKNYLYAQGFSVKIYDHPEESNDQLGIKVFYEKLIKALEFVQTPFVVIISGDDFTIPETIKNACNILNKDMSLSACAGKGLLYNPLTKDIFIYPQIERMAPEKDERLYDYIVRPTALFYSVFHLIDLKYFLEKTKDFISNHADLIHRNISFCEHILSFLIISKGRFYVQDDLYFIRLQSDQQTGRRVLNILESYISGDVEYFIKNVSLGNKADNKLLSSAYIQYIYRRGRNDPFFVLKNPHLMKVSFFRSINLFMQSIVRVPFIKRSDWRLDNLHEGYLCSPSGQLVMSYLL